MASAQPSPLATRWAYALIGLMALIGLGLRLAAAQGGLWLDEAWSAVFAHEARSPLDIFFAIPHDNNHYLNTLWLYITGWGAPPAISRLLSIVTGTLTILVGGAIGMRRGPAQGVLVALFFAISPMLVAYGAEARGYAPMFLALCLAIWVIARWLDQPEARPPSLLLALITTFGVLSHLTMLFAMTGIGVWVVAVLAKGRNPNSWLRPLIHLFGPSLLVAMAILANGVLLPLLGPGGYQVGGYEPFSLASLWAGLVSVVQYTLGLRGPVAYAIILPLALLLPLLRRTAVADRLFFQLCMASLFTVPLLFLITQVGNAGFGRYQLLTCCGLLLVASEIIALGLANRSWHRAIAVVALIALLIGCLTVTFGIATSRRGDPSGAITAMAEQARGGATILVGHDRDVAVIEAAAASAGYKVRIEETRCAGAQFLFLEQPDLSTLPHQISLCGLRYISIAERARTELSGMAWRLYQREQDQAGRRSSAARNTS